MKIALSLLVAAAGLLSSAVEPVGSFTLESGALAVRVDGKKFDTINRIDFNGKRFGIDNPGAHYGAVVFFDGAKGFIGSGHTETGTTEKLLALSVAVDGKESVPENGAVYKGSAVSFSKRSLLGDLAVDYTAVLQNEILTERATVTAEKTCKVKYLYLFMHPWSTDFTDFFAVSEKGKEYRVTFASDDKFPLRDRAAFGAWYNRKTGDGLVSVVLPGEGQNGYLRFLWDRKVYRKDYLVDFYNAEFPAGRKAVYETKTAFFVCKDAAAWESAAKALADRLLKGELK